MNYDSYRYIFPPRAEYPVHPDTLSTDRYKGYGAQPKLNGDCTLIFTNGTETIVMDRNNKPFKKVIPMLNTLKSIHTGTKWMVLVGEHMIKSKKNIQGEIWNNKFVIFDIIVHDNIHLLGQTFEQRIELLDKLFGTMRVINDPFLYATPISDVFRVRTFYDYKEFTSLFKELIKTDMYEGIVLKKLNSPLQNGTSSTNNHLSQVKTRKPTKNYNF